MFNLLPGQGLGMSASQDIALGLWSLTSYTPEEEYKPPVITGAYGGGGVGFYKPFLERTDVTVLDNVYSHREDDIVEILAILFGVIE